MRSLGEVDFLVIENSTGNVVLRVRALVMRNLGAPCYGGQTFHLDNGIIGDVTTNSISLHNGRFSVPSQVISKPSAHPPPYFVLPEHPITKLSSVDVKSVDYPIRQNETVDLKHARSLLPLGSYDLNLKTPPTADSVVILPEPPKLSGTKNEIEPTPWPPQVCPVTNKVAKYTNFSEEPYHHPPNVHFRVIQLKEVSIDEVKQTSQKDSKTNFLSPQLIDQHDIMKEIKINRDLLSQDQLRKAQTIIARHSKVFDENLSEGYDAPDKPYFACFTFKDESKPPS